MNEPAHNYTRTKYGGKTVNRRTLDMLLAAESIFGEPFVLSQGSYNAGVSASAGTHDRGGVVDISVNGMSSVERDRAVQALRRVGFFAWLRTPPKFTYHIHAVAIGDRELSPAAQSQVKQGFADRDGLAGRGPDPAPDPYPTWVGRYGRHVSPDTPPARGEPTLADVAAGRAVLVVNSKTGRFVTQTTDPDVWKQKMLEVVAAGGKVGGYLRWR